MRHENRERLMACLLAVLQLAASAQQANLTAEAARGDEGARVFAGALTPVAATYAHGAGSMASGGAGREA
ncbi:MULTISPECIES: hypothetical protein [unclassified Pantoea]|uniref:hypothetical protein n=1 Tax=unclassified Pantoea TaxID=2630326 RepID=UPI002477AF45|nr:MULTISPECIES: hypothetical protein [unclassified Pantoea]GME48218.1 hypothetical protein ACJ3_44970 [Pantoea sp. QMID3]GME48340.1 hypothetical protein ACJ1_44690 [Pantoea sp. QMID1]GME62990.1 hypothetical protein ACJ4_44850 [Pantoea sp. QMID4]GME64072.1 hypothetical protein ACJ2_44970 [Pantoea sp. QMID2]